MDLPLYTTSTSSLLSDIGANVEHLLKCLMCLTSAVQSIFSQPLKLLQNTMYKNFHGCGQLVATIKAVHTGPNSSKASTDNAGGLQPVVCLAKGALCNVVF